MGRKRGGGEGLILLVDVGGASRGLDSFLLGLGQRLDVAVHRVLVGRSLLALELGHMQINVRGSALRETGRGNIHKQLRSWDKPWCAETDCISSNGELKDLDEGRAENATAALVFWCGGWRCWESEACRYGGGGAALIYSRPHKPVTTLKLTCAAANKIIIIKNKHARKSQQ